MEIGNRAFASAWRRLNSLPYHLKRQKYFKYKYFKNKLNALKHLDT